MAEKFLKNLARLGVRKPLRGGEFGFAWLAVATALVLAQNPACASRAPGPDTYGYTVAATTDFTFLQITNAGSSRVLWFNDDAPYTANLGFTFNFYGSNYTSVSFTPNGLMTFGGTNSAYSNVDLTITSLSTNLPGIAVLWDDWETQETWADGVYYKTTNTAPNRQFIVQWNKVVPVNGDGTNTVTFEARLFEGSDKILFSYFDTVVSDESTPAASLGIGATVGICDVSGQSNGRNLEWSYNQGIITNGLNLLFIHPDHPPIATNDTVTTAEDTAVTISVLANDYDPDGDALTLTAVTQGANGLVTTNVNGTVTYGPATNFFGSDQFTYTLSDGQGSSATGTVNVTVLPVNDPPTLGVLSNVTVDQNSVIGPVAFVVSDLETPPDALTLSVTSSNTTLVPTNAILFGGSGRNRTVTVRPALNQIGRTLITVTVRDSDEGTASSAFLVTVWLPLKIQSLARQPGGSTVIRFQGMPERLYAVEASADLRTWKNLGVAMEEAPGAFFFEDAGAAGLPARFYRLRLLLRIQSIARLSSGSILIHFQGLPGGHYTIEASSDLRNWSSVGVASEADPGEFDFQDSGTPGLAARFYRLRAM